MSGPRDVGESPELAVRALLQRADELLKAATNRRDPTVAADAVRAALDRAGAAVAAVADPAEADELVVQIGRRADDLGLLLRGAHRESERGSAPRSVPLPQPGPGTLRPPARSGEDRVPPGQRLVRGLPVLHVGPVPTSSDVRVTVSGRVAGRRHVLSWEDLRALPTTTTTWDVHCVTAWSRLDATWTGVRVRDVLAHVGGALPDATHALVTGANAYSANLDLPTLLGDDVLLAWALDGEPLAPEHGAPLRLVVPGRYFWKSTKWVDGIQLLDRDVPGYWEARGYHNVADPFLEQRWA